MVENTKPFRGMRLFYMTQERIENATAHQLSQVIARVELEEGKWDDEEGRCDFLARLKVETGKR